MHIARTLKELREVLRPLGKTAFVPTMGNLHDGHLALVRHANTLADASVASIFVNRLQFLPHEDFERYPRTWAQDCEKLHAAGCNVLFAPAEAELYPQPQRFVLTPPAELAGILEGHFRPGFFTGVCTVVMKLFACVQPAVAVFGKKDYQQLLVIRQMAQQLLLPIDIVAHETARAPDGLALSSRNAYLGEAERLAATHLSTTLRAMASAVASGNTHYADLEAEAMAAMQARGWTPDYMVIRQRADLQAPYGNAPLVALGAARLGTTRLIDNFEVPEHA